MKNWRICPEHGTELVERRSRFGPFWCCPEIGCDVLCGNTPHSSPANKSTRGWRTKAHAAFDPLWKSKGGMRRGQAYKWLQDELGLRPSQCHIGMFDTEQCCAVIDAVESRME